MVINIFYNLLYINKNTVLIIANLKEVFGINLENRVDEEVVEVSVIFPPMVVVVNKVFDIVVRTNELNFLFQPHNSDSYYLREI